MSEAKSERTALEFDFGRQQLEDSVYIFDIIRWYGVKSRISFLGAENSEEDIRLLIKQASKQKKKKKDFFFICMYRS